MQPIECVESFSTSPMSTPTHWKQTVFLLRDPIVLTEGDDTAYLKVCVTDFWQEPLWRALSIAIRIRMNSRELVVEIHYTTTPPDQPASAERKATVQLFQVR